MASKSIQPLISVVTAVYNGEQFLEQSIKSVLYQTYDNIELIIIDGGSTDRTLEIINKYAKHIHYWVSEPDHGLYDALAKGFAVASGDILCWLNSDDIYFPWTLSKVAEVMSLPDCMWVTGTPAWINEKNLTPQIGLLKKYPRMLIQAGYVHGEGWGFIQQESTFFGRNLYEQSGGINRKLCLAGDFLLWKKMAYFSKLKAINHPLAAFRICKGQLSENRAEYYKEVYQNGGRSCKALRFLQKITTFILLLRRSGDQ